VARFTGADGWCVAVGKQADRDGVMVMHVASAVVVLRCYFRRERRGATRGLMRGG